MALTSSSDSFLFPLIFPLIPVPLIYWRYTHSQFEEERLEKTQWDLREAAPAAVIPASGMWMIVSRLMNLWGE